MPFRPESADSHGLHRPDREDAILLDYEDYH